MLQQPRIAFVILVALSSGLAVARTPLPPETQDQDPAAVSPRDNLGARSPAKRVATGSYVSVQVNVDALGRNIVGDAANEPSIAVNPVNPNNMVVGWRQFDSVTSNFRQGGWGYTFNKGSSWTFPGVLTPGTFRSDPVIDVDASGVFYYQSLKSNFTLDVFTSLDGGVSWSAPVASFGGDKNWLVVDRTGGAADGSLYGIWQRFFSCCDPDVLTRSVDGGQSFQAPVPMATSPTFGTLAVGPDGTLFATGIDGTVTQDFDHFVVAQSVSPPNPATPLAFTGKRVDLGGGMDLGVGPNPQGLLGQGNVATDHSAGSTRGNIYVLASVIPVGGNGPDGRQLHAEHRQRGALVPAGAGERRCVGRQLAVARRGGRRPQWPDRRDLVRHQRQRRQQRVPSLLCVFVGRGRDLVGERRGQSIVR